MNRRSREIHLQTLPVIAVVEGDRDARLRARVQQSTTLRVLAHYVDVAGGGKAAIHLLPGGAVVMRTQDAGPLVIQCVPVDGSISGAAVEVRGVHYADIAPRAEARRRNVFPVLSAVPSQLDETIIRTRPNFVRIEWRRRHGIDHSAAGDLLEIAWPPAGRRLGTSNGARQVGTDCAPARAVVQALPHHLGAEVERLWIFG